MSVRIVNAKAHAKLYKQIKEGGGHHLIEEHIGDSNLIFGSTGWCLAQSNWWLDNFMGFLSATNIFSPLINGGLNVSGHSNGWTQYSLDASFTAWRGQEPGVSVPAGWYGYERNPATTAGGFDVFHESLILQNISSSTSHGNNGVEFTSLTQSAKKIGSRDQLDLHVYTIDGLAPSGSEIRPCWQKSGTVEDLIEEVVKFDAAEVGYKRTVVSKPAEPSYAFGRRARFQGVARNWTRPNNIMLGVVTRPTVTRGYACTPLVYIGGNGLRVFGNNLTTPTNNFRGLRGRVWRDVLNNPTQPILVWIRSGLNDRNDTSLSADGVNAGNTAAGYVANLKRCQDLVLDFYERAGHSLSDVYFAYSMGVPNRDDGNAIMKSMGAATAEFVASSDAHQSVYLDSINDVTPAQLIANGGYASGDTDTNHLSSTAYNYFVDRELSSYLTEIEAASVEGGHRSRARYDRAR